jgi:DNA-binding MarR family transcriptional regulator
LKNVSLNSGDQVTQLNKAGSEPAPKARQVDEKSLRQFFGYNVKRAHNIIRANLLRTLEPFGLRITTYSSLLLIVDNPGIRQSELAKALDIERPNMVVILDDLEQQNWITRERVKTDRRAYALTATLSGIQLAEKAVAKNRANEERLLRELTTDERDSLLSALNLIENIQTNQEV